MKGRAAVVGAGIGGLTAAIALARRGWKVTLYERARAVRAVGSGIYLFGNGLRILESLGALQHAVAGAHWGSIRETRDAKNRVTARHRYDERGRSRVVAVVRQRLMDALLRCAQERDVGLVMNAEAVAAETQGAVRFADGSAVEAELVVAADGVNSRLRDSLGLLGKRVQTGDGAIRVMVPRTAEERGSEDGQKFIEYWAGTRRVLYTPCDEHEIYLALTCANDDPARALPLDVPAWTASFPHLAPLLARINGGRWDPFDVIRLKRWSRGRVAIIGDAAHAMAPNLGQGGGSAMMGAVSLAHYLDAAGTIEQALGEWEARERPLIDHTQRMSSLLSAVTFWPEGLRSLFFRAAGRSKWFSEQRWRAAHHIPSGI